MKCSVCNVNTAVVYITKVNNGKFEKLGLCIPCAQKQGVAPIEQMMKQAGLSDEELSNINEQMMEMLEENGLSNMDGLNESEDMNQIFGMFENHGKPKNEDEESDNDDENSIEDGNNGIRTKKKKRSEKKRLIDEYATNLTNEAKKGKIDGIVGRNREIDRLVQILNRRTKNNPVLIGEAGVGKTAIAEGLAVRIVEKEVPAKLLDSEVYLLDLTAIVAGTQFRGQFENRMRNILNEVKSLGNIILVIDELHNIVGAGNADNGAMNAANILKPALARGEIQIIGATTLDEYRKHIEKDSALERRFQKIIVEEPSVEETIEILKGIKHYYEAFHKVRLSDEVIEFAVKLADKYVHDRFFPDKAIDIIDEAGSRSNLRNKGLVELKALKEELIKVVEQLDDSIDKNDFQKAAELRTEELRIEGKIQHLESQSQEMVITKDDVASIVEMWTKIPVHTITEFEAEKLLKLEERLHTQVIGQDNAVKALAKSIRRNRSGFRTKHKPTSFIFVGPTGVGKTELAKAVAKQLFSSEDAIIRFDMSEYMEKHTVSKLIGAPPGYVGYDKAGILTEKIRRRPYSVLLFDEIEKAHPDVFNILLQILEDGRLTDNEGKTINFDNTIIILTSNAGTDIKSNGIGYNKDNAESLNEKMTNALKQVFRPEFLNRIDEIIVFHELNKLEMYAIIDLMLYEVRMAGMEKKMIIDFDPSIKDILFEKGFDRKYGARPLRRTIQRLVEDEISEQYLRGIIHDGQHILLTNEEGQIVIKLI